MWPALLADNFVLSFHHFLATLSPRLPPCPRCAVLKHGCQYGTVMNKGLHIHTGECFGLCKCVCVYVRACARGACRCGSMCVPMTHWACATSHRTKTHENITAASPLSFCLPTAAILPVPPQPSPLFSSFLKVQAQSNQAGNESGRWRRSIKIHNAATIPHPDYCNSEEEVNALAFLR